MDQEKKYNAHYEKYRDTILKNAKKYYKKKAEEKREERRKQIALDYLKEKMGIGLDEKN